MRHKDVEINPCVKEQDLSYKCLNDNGYDKEKCSKHFQNYKNCKEFWYKVKNYRRQNGIKPELPAFKDRDSVKEEYKRFMGF